jgi:SOS response regulatory protein OraA/RecX
MDSFLLENYSIQERGKDKLLILLKGNRVYRSVLEKALPQNRLSKIFDDQFDRFDWGTFIYDIDSSKRAIIESLLQLCQHHVYIDDEDLTEVFALDFHKTSATGSRTELGKLVNQAKPYEKPVTKTHYVKAQELAEKMCEFIRRHPTYSSANTIITTPSKSQKVFDLPSELTKHIAKNLKKNDLSSRVHKQRTTKAMKNCKTIQEKFENVHNAFAVTQNAKLKGLNIILVDDIYHTGFTMNEVGRVLLEAGASSVLGLVATKTITDL